MVKVPSLALLFATALLACDRSHANKVLTSADAGWMATSFAYREYRNEADLSDWTLVTDVRYDDQSTWTFTDDVNAVTAMSLGEATTGEVVAPDGFVVDLDWEVGLDPTGEAFLTLYLYEDAVFHQGLWTVALPELEEDHMTWVILAENVDSHRIEAELELEPR